MASNPMLQSVLLFQHHQTTTPYLPVPSTPARAAEPEKTEDQNKEGETNA